MKLFSWLFIVLLGLAVIVLSIGNKDSVAFSLYPLPFELDLPLFVLILAGGFIGVLLGSLRTWIADGKARSASRAHKQEVLRLQAELDRLKKEQADQSDAISQDAEHLLKLAQPKQTSAH